MDIPFNSTKVEFDLAMTKSLKRTTHSKLDVCGELNWIDQVLLKSVIPAGNDSKSKV